MCKKKETFNLEWTNTSVTVEREIQHVNSPYMSISVVWINKRLNEPFFEINVMIKLKISDQLETNETNFIKKVMTPVIAPSI